MLVINSTEWHEQFDRTHLSKISGKINESRQAVPNLTNDNFPNLGFTRPAPFFGLDFSLKGSLGHWYQLVGEERQGVVGDSRSHEGKQMCSSRLGNFSRTIRSGLAFVTDDVDRCRARLTRQAQC